MTTRRPRGRTFAAGAAALAAWDAQAALVDRVSTFDAYAVFAVSVAVVIVLLLWFALNDEVGDDRARRVGGGKQAGKAGFERRDARAPDRQGGASHG